MSKVDPTRRELDKLRALDLSQRPIKELQLALGQKSSAVVRKAAMLASQAGLPELTEALIAAYHRQTQDPGCETKTAIVRSLIELEAPVEEFYLSQRCYRQHEKAYGGSVETAGELRGLCLLGLARCNYPRLLEVLVDLMLDEDLNTRLMAVRAAGDSGQPSAVPLLRLKALTEREPEVIAECLISLLHLAPEETCGWIGERLLEAHWEACVLALGCSRHKAALDLLLTQYRPSMLWTDKRTLLNAIATCRQAEGVEFLLGILRDEPELARKALEIYRGDSSVWSRVESA